MGSSREWRALVLPAPRIRRGRTEMRLFSAEWPVDIGPIGDLDEVIGDRWRRVYRQSYLR